MTDRFIHNADSAKDRRTDAVLGGKAANLLALDRLGQPVPWFFVVTTAAFAKARADSGLDERIESRLKQARSGPKAALADAADEIREWIVAMPIPDDVAAAISAALKGAGLRDVFVAVRSSAAGEDAGDESFAGMHESFLFVRGAEPVLDAVKKVWASAYQARALAYRRDRKLSWDGIAVAVVVQKMIDADRSGVMFTCNPASGSAGEIVVSAVYGAGEGLVSGELDADTHTLDKKTLAITSEIACKNHRMVPDSGGGGGLIAEDVPDGRREIAALSDEEIRAVARAGLEIERHFGRPQDIEFCFDRRGSLHIVQARPVTNVPEYGQAAGHHLVWDNSNIIESYSGVTSPMTFSFIRRAYTIVYHCFAEVMGIPRRVVRANQGTFENMLGLFQGNVYYNLRNWYRLVKLFPGYQYNRKFMESMMGVKEALEDDADEPAPGFLKRYFVGLPGLISLVLRTTWNFFWIRVITGRFQKRFRRHYQRWCAMDLDAIGPAGLMNLYNEMEDKLLWNWRAPIINDFYVMVNYGILRKLCGSWCGDETGTLQNDLICGEGGIESAEPARVLMRLTAMVRQSPALADLIRDTPLDEVPARVEDHPGAEDFKRGMRDYLDRYGFRCPDELKLEAFSYRDRPELVYQIIRNYLAIEDPDLLDVAAMERREKFVRHEAEIRAFSPLRRRRRQFLKRWAFKRVLRNARLGVKNRENMRFARTRIYGLLREVLRALGRHLATGGLIDEPHDVFYLTLDEAWDFVKGTAVTTDLAALTRLRRAEFDEYRKADPLPDRFETWGMAYHRNRFHEPMVDPDAVADNGTLQGIGCCPGEVTAPVRIVRKPEEAGDLSGRILVAERTDPGWVTLYPAARGILVERGSVLSHSAVVAREMGIPTIVGISGLTKILRDGETVTMDGRAGTVLRESDSS